MPKRSSGILDPGRPSLGRYRRRAWSSWRAVVPSGTDQHGRRSGDAWMVPRG